MNQNTFKKQPITSPADLYSEIHVILETNLACRPFVVCTKSFDTSVLVQYLNQYKITCTCFSAFQPNFRYESILEGIQVAREAKCDFLLSIGGGSAIDLAKCINVYLYLDTKTDLLLQNINECAWKHLAIPTTAGTGSESTQFAVIYVNGEKVSVSHPCMIPDYVILSPSLLHSLPDYQKKCTLLDALCQSIESFWSIHSTDESKMLAKNSIQLILSNLWAYFTGDENAAFQIMKAANLSGQAINMTRTTAAHAMSYKLTALYGIPHGRAVAVCLPALWEYLDVNSDCCIDARGTAYLSQVLKELDEIFLSEQTGLPGYVFFHQLLIYFNMIPLQINAEIEIDSLAAAVNSARLGNFPVSLGQNAICELYKKILYTGAVTQNEKQNQALSAFFRKYSFLISEDI